MKHRELPQFQRDYARLTDGERMIFVDVLRSFVAACDRYALNRAQPWPKHLRVKPVRGSNALEMTWSFSGPDGRATFHFETVDGELRVVWRRVGRHAIFAEP